MPSQRRKWEGGVEGGREKEEKGESEKGKMGERENGSENGRERGVSVTMYNEQGRQDGC